MTAPETSHESGMWLTLREASRAFDVSMSTLHRRRKSGDLENVGAFQDNGVWKIPRQGLARLGFKELIPPVTPGQTSIDSLLKEPDSPSEGVPLKAPDTSPDISETLNEVQRLKDELNEALRRAEVAEAVSRERDRLIQAQARELARLEAGSSHERPSETPQKKAPDTPAAASTPKRSRWRRWFGA